MSVLKFILLWIVLTVVMMVSWSIGITLGNAITQSVPPPLSDPSTVAMAFLVVCLVNSLFVSLLIWRTRSFNGRLKWMSLVVYVWVIQFVLTQMETFFFVRGVAMSTAQIVSIVLAGAVMSVATVSTGILTAGKMTRAEPKRQFHLTFAGRRALLRPLLVLTVVAYPLIYFIFGYFVAWQSEAVRIFYTNSVALDSFIVGTAKAIADGVYFYQILRAGIWVIVSVPVIVMLRGEIISRYFLAGTLSALPAVLLFIPNPYMPMDVAMAHFMETSTSNFIWGIVIASCVDRAIRRGRMVLSN